MENFTIFYVGFALLAVAIWLLAREARREKWQHFLLTATVDDIIRLPQFKTHMSRVLQELNDQRAKDAVKAGKQKGRLKSHPIEHLQDEGVFNADNMQELYLHAIQKTLIGYSQRERTFIRDVGQMAYNRTMIQLCKRAHYTPTKKG